MTIRLAKNEFFFEIQKNSDISDPSGLKFSSDMSDGISMNFEDPDHKRVLYIRVLLYKILAQQKAFGV